MSAEWLPVKRMAAAIGVDEGWIKRRLQRLGCQPVQGRSRMNQRVLLYSPQCLEQLRQLRQQETNYPPAGDWLTLAKLAKAIGRHPKWTVSRLEKLGIKSETRISTIGRSGEYYPPTLVDTLLPLANSHPFAGNWLTINQIAMALRVDREWVIRRLGILDVLPQLRRIKGSGKTFPHYPPRVVKQLSPWVEEVPPGGDWLTKNAIEWLLDRSANWVKRHIAKFADQAEIRRDYQGNARLHYPPQVLQALFLEREEYVPTKPFRELLWQAHTQHKLKWKQLQQAASESKAIADIIRRVVIKRTDARRLVNSLIVLVPALEPQARAYLRKLQELPPMPTPIQPRKSSRVEGWRQAVADPKHSFGLRKLGDWYFVICQSHHWSSEGGLSSEEEAKQAFVEHVRG